MALPVSDECLRVMGLVQLSRSSSALVCVVRDTIGLEQFSAVTSASGSEEVAKLSVSTEAFEIFLAVGTTF